MKATEQYFPVVMFIVLYKVVLTFESVDKIPQCDHLTENLLAEFSFESDCFSIFCKVIISMFRSKYISNTEGCMVK